MQQVCQAPVLDGCKVQLSTSLKTPDTTHQLIPKSFIGKKEGKNKSQQDCGPPGLKSHYSSTDIQRADAFQVYISSSQLFIEAILLQW